MWVVWCSRVGGVASSVGVKGLVLAGLVGVVVLVSVVVLVGWCGLRVPSWCVRVWVGCPVLALGWLVGCALRVVWVCVFECFCAGWGLNFSRRGWAGGGWGHGGRVGVGVFACGCRKAGEGEPVWLVSFPFFSCVGQVAGFEPAASAVAWWRSTGIELHPRARQPPLLV